MERRLFTKADALLLALVALLTAGLLLFLLFPRGGHLTAEITTDSGTRTVDLEKIVSPYTETVVSNGHTLTLSFDRGSVQVAKADCPDKCCVSCGKLTRNGQCAVCLPARVTVRVFAGKESGVDAIV